MELLKSLFQLEIVCMKIAGTDQVSFGPVPVLMVVKIIWSTVFKPDHLKRSHVLGCDLNAGVVACWPC